METSCTSAEVAATPGEALRVAGYLISADEFSPDEIMVIVKTSDETIVQCRTPKELSKRLANYSEGDAVSVEGEVAADNTDVLELKNCRVF